MMINAVIKSCLEQGQQETLLETEKLREFAYVSKLMNKY
jgi:hypothetical protein